jgi:hypothetical protein
MLKPRSMLDAVRVQLRDLSAPPLSADPLPVISPARARGVVTSFYMPNVSRRVVAAQRAVIKKYLPPNLAVEQVLTMKRHEDAMTHYMRTTPFRAVLFLDIDCVPVADGAIDRMFRGAEAGELAGSVQRSNHIQNNQHLYVAPSCMALSGETYRRLGQPDFESTPRGDVGEELTYEAEARGVSVRLLWPVSSEDFVWDLIDGKRYGHGTTFEGGFWHAFQIRFRQHQDDFIRRCEGFLAAASS